VRHGESARNAGAPQGSPPPSNGYGPNRYGPNGNGPNRYGPNGYGPYGILAVCRINLWPAGRIELGKQGWLKQPVAKVRGPILAGDQGSRRGHHCSETELTGNPSSKEFRAMVHPGGEPLPPVAGSKRLVHWTSETW
jgi:hypothetical protein